MNLFPQKYFKYFFALVAIVFSLHFLMYRAFLANIGLSLQALIEIYIFLVILSVIHFYALNWLFKKWSKHAGFIFTGLSLLKMAASVLYLLPLIFPPNKLSVMIAINFMLIYFVLLTYEVIFIAKSLGKNH